MKVGTLHRFESKGLFGLNSISLRSRKFRINAALKAAGPNRGGEGRERGAVVLTNTEKGMKWNIFSTPTSKPLSSLNPCATFQSNAN